MARLVEEIMNRELFNARPDDLAEELIGYFSALGIAASPVLDRSGDLVGMVSLRDLIRADPDARVEELMTTPAETLSADTSIEEAARVFAEKDYHRFPVVGARGRVIGIVSSMDIIRGLTGSPARHPQTFPHYDSDTQLTWSDDEPFDMEHAEAAEDGPGVLALVHGGVGVRETVVWAEMSANIRTRLLDILTEPQEQYPALQYWLDKPPLRFRAAPLMDRRTGRRVVDKLQRSAGYALF